MQARKWMKMEKEEDEEEEELPPFLPRNLAKVFLRTGIGMGRIEAGGKDKEVNFTTEVSN